MKLSSMAALASTLHVSGDRLIVGIAGAPGSGKSTLADELAGILNKPAAGTAAVLPMDGYHYDDRLLVALGRKERKGAPDTFDIDGLHHTLARLRKCDGDVAVPIFDRDLEISRAGARLIPPTVRIVVVEGNYLLLSDGDWARLFDLFDVTVMVQTSEAELRRRLTRRWKGYNLPPAEVSRKVEMVDLSNARIVTAQSRSSQYEIQNSGRPRSRLSRQLRILQRN